MQQIEEEGGERYLMGELANLIAISRAPCRHLEWSRAPARAEGDDLAVEHDGAGRYSGHRPDYLWNPGGDLIERAGEDRHVGAVLVDLDPDPVDLSTPPLRV